MTETTKRLFMDYDCYDNEWYWRPWTIAVGHGFLGAVGAMIVVVPIVLVLR